MARTQEPRGPAHKQSAEETEEVAPSGGGPRKPLSRRRRPGRWCGCGHWAVEEESDTSPKRINSGVRGPSLIISSTIPPSLSASSSSSSPGAIFIHLDFSRQSQARENQDPWPAFAGRLLLACCYGGGDSHGSVSQEGFLCCRKRSLFSAGDKKGGPFVYPRASFEFLESALCLKVDWFDCFVQ